MIFGISKTTVAGVLSFLIATLTTITAFQVPNLTDPHANHLLGQIAIGCNIAVALCRVWIGLLQGDAPPNPPPAAPANK